MDWRQAKANILDWFESATGIPTQWEDEPQVLETGPNAKLRISLPRNLTLLAMLWPAPI